MPIRLRDLFRLPRQTEQTAAAAKPLGRLPEWNLADLYPGIDAAETRADLDRVKADAQAFEGARKGTLADLLAGGTGGDGLAAAVGEYEALGDRLGRLAAFASLTYAGDTTDAARAKFYGDVQDRLTAAGSHLLFFELELNRLEDAALEAATDASADLARYRPWLTDLRREKPYQLSDDLERLFHEKAITARSAWSRLFDETIAGIRVPLEDGAVTLEEALNQLLDPVEARRRKAADGIAGELSANARVFTLITNTLAKDKEIGDRWRGFSDVAASRHLSNRVEPEVVDALVSAVREAYPRLSHRYYAMKAKWLGKPVLDYWDRNAPLPDSDDRIVSWDEARETVLTAYGAFAPEMADLAARFFDNAWIDAPVRPGKAPGAFSHPTVPSAHPYVLLNYMGRTRDVMTLAHELGHGVHQILAAPQGALMAPTPLTLAETASVFGEMLTFRKLLAGATDPVQRKAMLAGKVEDMLNTVVRQIAFYTFERRVHLERREGELTTDRLGEIWLEVQRESLGPAIRFADGYEIYWAYIPHFINAPFYVYAYAFGDCLVNSLYKVYEEAETGFQDKYFAMLKAGGTKHHAELLAPFGLDASDPAFWGKGLAVIEGLLDELAAADAAA